MDKSELVNRILERNTSEVISKKSLKQKLEAGRPLRIKFGIDPTSPDLHIGNAVLLWKLRDFQALGHQVIFLIGDFTARIGDPSDKKAMRQPLTPAEVKANMKSYTLQAAAILDIKKVEVAYNSKWLEKLGFEDVLDLAGNFTVAQMIERENFAKRLQASKPVGLHELLYPLMQGYDSVELKADVELGGTDQLFNMLAGREIQKAQDQKPQDVLTCELLLGLDGRKMSKSYQNYIALTDKPADMFGKAMSISDDLIPHYLELATDLPTKEVDTLTKDLKAGKANPRDAKAKMARALVARYHGSEPATKAEEQFEKVFKEKKLPEEVPEYKLTKDNWLPADLLVELKLAPSKSEARRIIESKGAKINQQPITDWKKKVTLKDGDIISVGKLHFAQVKLNLK
jgi:tyrosyl-tRNA synthetase